MAETKIKIYSTPYCGYCQLAKQYFAEQKITYEEINVATDEKAQAEMIAKSKQMGVPVIIIMQNGHEEIIVGFQKDKIKQILKIK